MAVPDFLAASFISALAEDLRAGATPNGPPADLQPTLAALIDNARAAWPSIELESEAYVRYLAERVQRPLDVGGLEQLHASDLYLACACARADRQALESFHRICHSDIEAALASMRISATLADETKQLVSEKLLVATRNEAPRICDYAGEGELRTWVRVIAVRFALGLLRKGKREVAVDDDALLSIQCADDDPEIALLKREYQAEFKEAFHEAVTNLDARERNLLRMHLLDGLSIDRVGTIYGIHRATAFRWIRSAREKVWSETRKVLSKRLKLSPSDYDSLVEQVRSQLDLSIERALQD